jgi:tetratricopeptide (TPR) repeat protein
LAAEKGIKVLGRSSARQLERDPDPKAIRASLGVTHLLEGSTRSAGNDLRVNVRLIDTADGSQLWEEEYQGRLADVFSVQDQIAGTVVRRLRGTFFGNAVRTAEATSIDAYETYLAARALMRTRSKTALGKALELAGKVITAEPDYAPGHAIYAELLYLLSDDPSAYGDIPLDRARALALPHARKAIRLAPDKPEGYAALGLILPRDQSIEPLNRAIALDPGRTELRIWLGLSLNELVRHDEAYEQVVAAAEAEPLWPVAINRLTQVLATSGKTREALEVVRKYSQRGGPPEQVHRFLATIARSTGDVSAAVRHDSAAHRINRETPYVAAWAARQYLLLGLHDRAAKFWPYPTPYGRLFIAGRREELLRRVRADGSKAWGDPDVDYAIFALAAARDWPTLAQLYRSRTPRFADYCRADPHGAPIMVMALRATGDRQDAQRVLDCATQRSEREFATTWAFPGGEPGRLEVQKASLLGAVGDRRGVEWLEKAISRGWVGQHYSSQLADWPQFDAFRSDPRYTAMRNRIDATIARERAETLAGR